MAGDNENPPDAATALAQDIWQTYAEMVRIEMRDRRLSANPKWVEMRQAVHADFVTAFEAMP